MFCSFFQSFSFSLLRNGIHSLSLKIEVHDYFNEGAFDISINLFSVYC